MSDAENPRAVMGDNEPPDPLITEAQERIDTANRYLTERGNLDEWTPEIADKTNAFLEQVRGTTERLNGQRMDENRTFEAAQKAKYGSIGDIAKGRPGEGLLGLLAKATFAVTRLKVGWLQRQEAKLREEKDRQDREVKRLADEAAKVAEKARLEMAKKGGDPLRAQQEAEAAERKVEEARQQAAAAPTRAQISGSFSSRASGLTTRWSAEITNLSDAFRHYNKKANPNKSILEEAIKACILTIAKREAVLHKDATKAPPGIKFVSERT